MARLEIFLTIRIKGKEGSEMLELVRGTSEFEAINIIESASLDISYGAIEDSYDQEFDATQYANLDTMDPEITSQIQQLCDGLFEQGEEEEAFAIFDAYAERGPVVIDELHMLAAAAQHVTIPGQLTFAA